MRDCLPRTKISHVPVAQRIERFPAEEEVSRSNRLRDAEKFLVRGGASVSLKKGSRKVYNYSA